MNWKSRQDGHADSLIHRFTDLPIHPFTHLPIHRLLVIAPNWIGDAVLSAPAVASIARVFPDLRIEILARGEGVDLWAGEKIVSFVLGVDGRRFEGKNLFAQARVVRERGYGGVVLFPNSFRSASLAFLAGIPVRIGYARDLRGWMLTHPVSVAPVGGRHQSEYYLDLLRSLGIPAESTLPRLHVSGLERDAARALITREGLDPANLVGFAPGAAYGGAKRWPVGRFAAVADRLAGSGLSVAVFGTAKERDVGEVVCGRRPHAINLAGKTSVREFMSQVSLCRVLVTNDSGAMHVAAALGVPVVAVFGPTDPRETGPLGAGHAVIRESVDCAPCFRRECPIDHRCMRGIPVERVFDAAVGALDREGGDGESPE